MKNQPIVYLAGAITGCSYADCTEWREGVQKALAEVGIRGVSPMRMKHYLQALKEISGHGREYKHLSVLSGSRGIVTRDHFDVHRADVVLANLKGCTQASIGTMFELAWAWNKRTPIVAVMDEMGHPHDHMFVHEVLGFRVGTMEEAVDVVKAILL